MSNTIDMAAFRRVMNEAKRLAKQYRILTGKLLGITGEWTVSEIGDRSMISKCYRHGW